MALLRVIPPCDNKSACHEPFIVGEDDNGTRYLCRHCKHQMVVRKDWRGIHDNRSYSELFRRDILQGNDNLFYKYHPQYLST